MSRAALSKSRLEKGRANALTVQVPLVSAEIVPGRFTEADWNSMVEAEEGEEIVSHILESLLHRVMDGVFEVYLSRQRIPFTISQARDAVVKIAEWLFLVRDEGEPGITVECTCAWQEDEEPSPCITDSWAQGSVPVVHTGFTPRTESQMGCFAEPKSTLSQEVTDAVKLDAELTGQLLSLSPEEERDPEHATEEGMLKSDITEVEKELESPHRTKLTLLQPAPPPKQGKPRREFRPYRGPLRSAGLKTITKSLEDTEKEMLLQQLSQTSTKEEVDEGIGNFKLLPTSFHNILRIQLNRPAAQNKDVMYDEFGNITSVPKLDPARLPRHWVKPQVEVVDIQKEMGRHHKEVVRARGPVVQHGSKSKAARPKRLTADQSGIVELMTPLNDPSRVMTGGMVLNRFDQSDKRNFDSSVNKSMDISGPISLRPPILLESMKLAPGVMLREANGTDRNSWRSLRKQECEDYEPQAELRPIRTTMPCPSVTVDQLLKNHVPQVRPIASLPSFAPSLRGHS